MSTPKTIIEPFRIKAVEPIKSQVRAGQVVPNNECGVLFHLIGAVSEFGKLGLTAIANSPAEAQAIYERTLAVLAAETHYGHPPVGWTAPPA